MKNKNLVLVLVILGIMSSSFHSCKKDDNDKIDVLEITLNETSLILEKGSEHQLTVTKFTPDDATEKDISWTTADASVATVDNTGKVTAVDNGFTNITATAESGVTAVCSMATYDGTETKRLDWKGITAATIDFYVPSGTLVLVYDDNGAVTDKLVTFDIPATLNVTGTGSVSATNPIQDGALLLGGNQEMTYLDCSNNLMHMIGFYKSVTTLICDNCSKLEMVQVEGAENVSDVAGDVLTTLQGIANVILQVNNGHYKYIDGEWTLIPPPL